MIIKFNLSNTLFIIYILFESWDRRVYLGISVSYVQVITTGVDVYIARASRAARGRDGECIIRV